LDLAKYRTIFIEESTEHFAEMSGALLELEKDPASAESIDLVFRLAHSIKGMAGSLGYDSITEVAHRLEDRMQAIRAAGCVPAGAELSLLFEGLSALESMVEGVRETSEAPPADPRLVAALAAPVAAGPDRASSAAAPTPDPAPQPKSDLAETAKKKAPEPLDSPSGTSARRTPDASRPPPTVRVNTETLDRFLSTVGEVILNTSQVRTAAEGPTATPVIGEGLDRMDRVVGELQRRALELRTTHLLRIVEPLPRTAREIAQRAGKRVEVSIEGASLELDRSILDRLGDPLVHLLRNAVDHGIELPDVREKAGKHPTGRILIEARRQRDSIRISVADDGAGIDLDAVRERAVAAGVLHAGLAEDLPPHEVAALIFHAGLSTSEVVSEISGRGVGMDAVRATIESLGGAVEIDTEPGRGTTTSLIVPITAAVQRVLLLGVRGETVALPIARIERVLEVPSEAIERSGGEAFALIDEELVPVFDLSDCIALAAAEAAPVVSLVLTEVRGARVALVAERMEGQQEIYVKPVPELLSGVRTLAGLTILGDGRPVFLLDLNQLA
jgi:two-component system chemotaxis sensor kinase CheA